MSEVGEAVGRIVVRKATARDARQLAGLRWDFKAEGTGLDPSSRESFVDRQTTWFSEAIAGDWTVFVVADDLAVLGQVFVRVVDKAPSPLAGATAIGYVTNFYVMPQRRGEGFGSRLLDAMRAWAEQVPLDALVVWPADDSVPDYERAGFRGGEVLQLRIGTADTL